MAHFGLDIGSYSIKLVQADGDADSATIRKVASVYNPVGQTLPNDANQFQKLAGVIKAGIREHGFSGLNCHVSLPGHQAYISIVSMPMLSDAELSSAIKWEAEQHIPVSLSEVNFEYDVIHRPEKGSSDENMSVLLVGAPKKSVDRYLELLELAGVEAIGLEPESLSMQRAYIPEKAKSPMATSLICNFGALSTSFLVADEGKIQVVHNASFGSLALTRALEKGLSLDPTHSEEYKRTYGLDPEKLEGKVKATLVPVFEALVREIRKTIQFYVSKSPGSNRVVRVIMCGGGANLPGIAAYLVELLSVEVVVESPFKRFSVDKKAALGGDVATYAIAVGLAVKNF